jgi:PAS domain S-box-containing protein
MIEMSEHSEKVKERKELLKSLVKRLHQGESTEKIKEQFKEAFKDVAAQEVARIEEELVKEGMSPEEIRKFCDVHIALFRESLDKQEPIASPGHPIHILMEEHKMLLGFAGELKELTKQMQESKDVTTPTEEWLQKLDHITKHLKESESHYLREENVLFPYLEKHGITQPPAMMWTEHDKIRGIKKEIYRIVDSHDKMDFKDFIRQLDGAALSLTETLSSHFYKENNILFPTSLRVISKHEFKKIRKQFDEIGYCCFTPESATVATEEPEERSKRPQAGGKVEFETGSLSGEQIEAMFDSLPVEITFVDKDDRVRYFSQPEDKIFLRTKAVLGNKVQQCHPQKSIHLVNQIVEGFKSGKRDVAEFWLNLKGRLVYIRYFPVRNKSGEYLGCMEVTQDITDIQKIKGEKRLL